MSELKTQQKGLRKERILWLLLFMAIFTTTFSVGSEIELDPNEAEIIKQQVTEKIERASSEPSVFSGDTIFLNNIFIGLIMFIPAVGVLLGLGVAFATGLAFSTFGLDIPAYTILFFSPFGLMELVAYSIAMSRSLLIVKYLIKHIPQPRKTILIEVGIVAGLIFLGSIIEAILISMY